MEHLHYAIVSFYQMAKTNWVYNIPQINETLFLGKNIGT